MSVFPSSFLEETKILKFKVQNQTSEGKKKPQSQVVVIFLHKMFRSVYKNE